MEPSTAFAERFYSDVEQEATNCFETANAVLSNDDCPQDDYSLQDTKLLNQLAAISKDLDNRWRGTLFSLNPQNPDATRHFCTSARELFTGIFTIKPRIKRLLAPVPRMKKHQMALQRAGRKLSFFSTIRVFKMTTA